MRHIIKKLCVISVFFMSTIPLWADSQSRHFIGQIGVGGAYYGFGGEDVSSVGGYLAGEARFFVLQRVQSVFGVRIGGGSSKAYQMPDVAEKSGFVISDQYFKVGVNIANLNAPLYLNLLAEHDNHNSKRGLSRELRLLGASIGFSRALSTQTMFYTKLIGKYQNLKSSLYSDGTQGYPRCRGNARVWIQRIIML